MLETCLNQTRRKTHTNIRNKLDSRFETLRDQFGDRLENLLGTLLGDEELLSVVLVLEQTGKLEAPP